MKEIIKFFGISLSITTSILTLLSILIGSYSNLNATNKELNLKGFWQCNVNNSKMAIKDKDEVSIIRNKTTKTGTYYHSVVDNSLSLTFIENQNKQTYTYIIISSSENEISFMDENGRVINCFRKTLNKTSKNMVSNQ